MNDVISNIGNGYWSDEDMLVSITDRFAPIDRSISVGVESLSIGNLNQNTSDQWARIEDAIVWLDLVSRWKARDHIYPQVRRTMDSVQRQAPTDRKKAELALSRLEEISARRPAPETTAEALRVACTESIKFANQPSSKGFAMPSDDPRVAWKVLGWLIGMEISEKTLHPLEWKGVFALVEVRLPVADKSEKEAIGELFRYGTLVAEHVRTSALVANASSEVYSLSDACITQLAYRRAFREMAEIGLGADPALKLRILRQFCTEAGVAQYPRSLRMSIYDDTEKKFWESCVRTDPWGSTYAMNVATGNNSLYLEPWLSILLRDAFKSVLDTAEKGGFPITSQEDMTGLRVYVKIMMRDPGRGSIRLLKRAVKLFETAPKDEPDANSKARKDLVFAAGRELRMEEYFR